MGSEQRQLIAVRFHVFGVGWHEQAHKALGFFVALFASHQNLVNIAAVKIADGTLHQTAFFIHQFGRGRLQGEGAHIFPKAQKMFKVALDFHLGAIGASGAQNKPHALRHFQLLRHSF